MNNLKTLLKNLARDEQGQDLIEYTLLLAFVCLASAGIFTSAGQSVKQIWGYASTDLLSAASAAAPSGS